MTHVLDSAYLLLLHPPTHGLLVLLRVWVCACMCVSRWDECVRYASMLTDARRQEAGHPKKSRSPPSSTLWNLIHTRQPASRAAASPPLVWTMPSASTSLLLLHPHPTTTTTPPTTTMWSLRQVSLTWENRQHSELIYNYITWAAHSAPFLFLPSLIFFTKCAQ